MEKIWYTLIRGTAFGPFSVKELSLQAELTPDTLVWKKGFADWVPIKEVDELKSIFQEIKNSSFEDLKDFPLHRPSSKTEGLHQDELVLDSKIPPPLFILILLIILIFLFVLFFFQS